MSSQEPYFYSSKKAANLLGKIADRIRITTNRHVFVIVAVWMLVIALPLSVVIVQQQTNTKQHAMDLSDLQGVGAGLNVNPGVPAGTNGSTSGAPAAYPGGPGTENNPVVLDPTTGKLAPNANYSGPAVQEQPGVIGNTEQVSVSAGGKVAAVAAPVPGAAPDGVHGGAGTENEVLVQDNKGVMRENLDYKGSGQVVKKVDGTYEKISAGGAVEAVDAQGNPVNSAPAAGGTSAGSAAAPRTSTGMLTACASSPGCVDFYNRTQSRLTNAEKWLAQAKAALKTATDINPGMSASASDYFQSQINQAQQEYQAAWQSANLAYGQAYGNPATLQCPSGCGVGNGYTDPITGLPADYGKAGLASVPGTGTVTVTATCCSATQLPPGVHGGAGTAAQPLVQNAQGIMVENLDYTGKPVEVSIYDSKNPVTSLLGAGAKYIIYPGGKVTAVTNTGSQSNVAINLNGALGQPASQLTPPASQGTVTNLVTIVTPSPTEGNQVSCTPRPTCLDTTPRCLIAERSDWCPANTISSSPSPSPSPTPSPTLSMVTASPSPSGTAGNTQLVMTLAFQGLGTTGSNASPTGGGNTKPKTPGRSVTVDIYDSTNTKVAQASGKLTFNTTSGFMKGTVATTLPAGSYSLFVKSDRYLRKRIPAFQTLHAGANTIPQTTLILGDINGDNKLDILDFNILSDCYNDKVKSATCLAHKEHSNADLNDDGVIDGVDYNFFISNLSNSIGD